METVRVAGGGGLGSIAVETHPTNSAASVNVGFAIDKVWAPLRAAYDSLAIPVTIMDVTRGTLGNAVLRVRRRLGNVAISKYVNCGSVQGAPSADSYEIQLSVVTIARPAELGTTTLTTSVDAQGRPITIASEYMRCTSTGVLETRIAELVNAQIHR